jgi:hypothetical protein
MVNEDNDLGIIIPLMGFGNEIQTKYERKCKSEPFYF